MILIHGLTGTENSMNMVRAALYHHGLGFPVLRLNLRGAGPSRATCEGDYHAGRSRDLADALTALGTVAPSLMANGIYISAVSLGANLMIKFLAEHGGDFTVRAAASISAPIDLAASVRSIMRYRNAPYHRWLLKRMIADFGGGGHRVAARSRLAEVRNVYEFDDRYVAPRHGFESATHYYEETMARRYLNSVSVPTLIIHAHNDPWIPVASYLSHDWSANQQLTPLIPRSGGHVGFHDSGHTASWHDRCAARFFTRY